MWYVYIIEFLDNNNFYVGITDNLDRRFNEHKNKKGGHYTSYHQVKRVAYSEVFENRLLATKREKQLKGWSNAKKIALIQNNKNELKLLSKSRD